MKKERLTHEASHCDANLRRNRHQLSCITLNPRPKATTLAVLGYIALVPALAHANCTTSGTTTTCDTTSPSPWTTMIGAGPTEASGSQVTVGPNAQVVVGNSSAIALAWAKPVAGTYNLAITLKDNLGQTSTGTVTVKISAS